MFLLLLPSTNNKVPYVVCNQIISFPFVVKKISIVIVLIIYCNFRSLSRAFTAVLQQLGREGRFSSQSGFSRDHVLLLPSLCAARLGNRPAGSRLLRLWSPLLSHCTTRTQGKRATTAILPLVQLRESAFRISARSYAAPACTSRTCGWAPV